MINKVGSYSESDPPSKPSTPSTLATPASKDASNEEVGGLIYPIGRKDAKRKVKEKIKDPVLDPVMKELSTLETTNVKSSTMFKQYLLVQEKKLDAASQVVQLRYQYQALKERE